MEKWNSISNSKNFEQQLSALFSPFLSFFLLLSKDFRYITIPPSHFCVAIRARASRIFYNDAPACKVPNITKLCIVLAVSCRKNLSDWSRYRKIRVYWHEEQQEQNTWKQNCGATYALLINYPFMISPQCGIYVTRIIFLYSCSSKKHFQINNTVNIWTYVKFLYTSCTSKYSSIKLQHNAMI